MEFLDELKELGVDVDKAVGALNGKSALYSKLVIKFYDMVKDCEIPPNFNEENIQEVSEKVHTLKGTSGNLSITPLYEAYSEIMQYLREKQIEKAQDAYKKVLPIQNQILQCIEKNK